ncbi:MAG: hypothetical protein ACT4NY_29410 [Pseudonocardiales bacterium]
MAAQISAAADYFNADTIVLIDVGGDALTDGAGPGPAQPVRRPVSPRRLRSHRPAPHRCPRHRRRVVTAPLPSSRDQGILEAPWAA